MTMYEKLMTLSIFKGIGMEQLSSFIEKAHLHFETYEAGELIAPVDEECDGLKCVLSGEIESVYTLSGGRGKLTVEYGPGKVIGLGRLYGMDTHYGHAIKAVKTVGTMEFSKQQYMTLLHSNRICLINFLNILSYKGQKIEMAVRDLYNNSLTGRIATTVSLLTDRDCLNIKIYGIDGLIKHANVEIETYYNEELKLLRDWNLISFDTDGAVVIPSRQAFLDYAENLNSVK